MQAKNRNQLLRKIWKIKSISKPEQNKIHTKYSTHNKWNSCISIYFTYALTITLKFLVFTINQSAFDKIKQWTYQMQVNIMPEFAYIRCAFDGCLFFFVSFSLFFWFFTRCLCVLQEWTALFFCILNLFTILIVWMHALTYKSFFFNLFQFYSLNCYFCIFLPCNFFLNSSKWSWISMIPYIGQWLLKKFRRINFINMFCNRVHLKILHYSMVPTPTKKFPYWAQHTVCRLHI